MSTTVVYSVILVAYLAAMVYVGWFFAKKVKDTASYYTTGRTMGAAVAGFSYAATQMSAGSVIGTPATVFKLGYNYAPVCIASTANPWFTFLTIGERIRRIAERINAFTYGDIFEARYGRRARYLYAVLVVVFFIPMMVGQLKACGEILKVMLGWNYILGMAIAGVVVMIYTWTGGMFAVAWTDLVQGLIMIVGVGGLAIVCVAKAGGMTAVHLSLKAIDPRLVRLSGLVTALWAASNILTWSILQIGGAAHSVVRFIIPKDMRSLRSALGYAVVFMAIIFLSVGAIGLAGRVLLPSLKTPDALVPTLAFNLLNPVFGAIVLCSILAAIMSSVDSALLLVSSAATRDLYVPLVNPKASDEQQLRVGRMSVVIVAAVSMLLAIRPIDAVQWLVAFSFQVLAASLTVPVLCAVWWPRASKQGALAAMYSGLASSLFWYYVGWNQFKSLSNWPYGLWPGILGTVVSLVFMVIVTHMTSAPDERTQAIFYAP